VSGDEDLSCSSVKVWQCPRTKAEPGLGYSGPGARRLGSTGTLGRRALWADGHAGPTGRAGPGPTNRRALEAEEGGRGGQWGPAKIQS